MPKITWTGEPGKVKEVSEAEVKNLRHMGLLATVDGKPVGEQKSEKKSAAPADEKKKEG